MATNGALPGSTIEGDFFAKRDILMDLRALRTSFQTLDTTSCGGQWVGQGCREEDGGHENFCGEGRNSSVWYDNPRKGETEWLDPRSDG